MDFFSQRSVKRKPKAGPSVPEEALESSSQSNPNGTNKPLDILKPYLKLARSSLLRPALGRPAHHSVAGPFVKESEAVAPAAKGTGRTRAFWLQYTSGTVDMYGYAPTQVQPTEEEAMSTDSYPSSFKPLPEIPQSHGAEYFDQNASDLHQSAEDGLPTASDPEDYATDSSIVHDFEGLALNDEDEKGFPLVDSLTAPNDDSRPNSSHSVLDYYFGRPESRQLSKVYEKEQQITSIPMKQTGDVVLESYCQPEYITRPRQDSFDSLMAYSGQVPESWSSQSNEPSYDEGEMFDQYVNSAYSSDIHTPPYSRSGSIRSMGEVVVSASEDSSMHHCHPAPTGDYESHWKPNTNDSTVTYQEEQREEMQSIHDYEYITPRQSLAMKVAKRALERKRIPTTWV